MNYHPLGDYAVLIRARLQEEMPPWLGDWEALIARFFPHFLQTPAEKTRVNLLSAPVKCRVFHLNSWRLPASGFELSWQDTGFSLRRALKAGALTLLILPLMLGLSPKKALAAPNPSRPENGVSPLSSLSGGITGLADCGQNALEVSDCPLKVKPRLLSATDCATAPHTFKLFSGSTGHMDISAWANSTSGTGHQDVAWSNAFITPHTNVLHGNVAHTNVHTNNPDSGWLESSLPRVKG